MKILDRFITGGFEVTARNVINTDKIKEWINDFKQRHSKETHQWIKSNLRNWLINSARARKVTEAPEDAPDWLKTAIENKEPVHEVALTQRLAEKINHMLDWLDGHADEYQDLTKLQVDVAFDKTDEWDEQARRQAKKNAPKISGEDTSYDVELVAKLSDGFLIVQLKTEEALKREGTKRLLCIRDTKNFRYWERVQSGDLYLLSLRDPQGEPCLTMEVDAKGNIDQLKGYDNGPMEAKYHKYIYEFLIKQGDTSHAETKDLIDRLLNPDDTEDS